MYIAITTVRTLAMPLWWPDILPNGQFDQRRMFGKVSFGKMSGYRYCRIETQHASMTWTTIGITSLDCP